MQEIQGVDDHRTLKIDGDNLHVPSSVFIHCGSFAVEVDREEFIEAVSAELGLAPLEWDIDSTLRQLLDR